MEIASKYPKAYFYCFMKIQSVVAEKIVLNGDWSIQVYIVTQDFFND